MTLTSRVKAWREDGGWMSFRRHTIHVHRREGADPTLLLLHGFPSSAYDWRRLLALETEHAAVTFDFLGFGLSDKPHDHAYSLLEQADLAEELVERLAAGRPVFVLAHDMGTSVATELMARDLDGELEMELAGALLFNGSIVLERASPTFAQQVLRSRIGPVASRLVREPFFRRQFARLFSPGHPLEDEEAADQWSLIAAGGGHRIGHLLIRYMDERVTHAERWHGAVRDWPKPLHLAWGMLDPVATPRVLEALLELRPRAPVVELDDLGHYPQIEAPGEITAALRAALAAPL